MQPFQKFLVAALALGVSGLGFAAQWTTVAPKGSTAVASTTASPAVSPVALPGEAAVRKSMTAIVPDAKIVSVRNTPIPGVLEVDTDDDVVYFSSDGKFVFTGNVIEVATRRDLTEASRAVARRPLLKGITPSQMIVFAPSHPKYTVTVFTDVDCGYCRKLHSQIAEYNKQGIAVDYLFFPREGIGSPAYDKAIGVWCASDRQKAFTDAKKGLPVAKGNCTNPVTMDYNLGVKVGVDGTPAVYTADGTQIGGYLSPAEMRAKLDKLAAQPSS